MAIVATRSGKVEGLERDGVHVFRGIPYAAPPVGPFRWQPPQPEPSWDGVRDATKFGAQSAQSDFPLTRMLGGTQPPCNEDSLFLNVWTPTCDDAARPVMVWIHGGAFIWGAGDTPWYDGTHFATHGDVVLVTINYRLGPFGFLYLPELLGAEYTSSGNLGVLDQIAALEWVRDCIAAFGGDPQRVTIFGESAGGGSVGTLLGTPAARGLFAGAIAQSGAASWIATPEHGTLVASRVFERLGLKPGDTDAALAKTTDEIIAALPAFREDGVTGLPFQPVLDGAVLPQHPLAAIKAGNSTGVHVLAGTNHDELTMFILSDPDYMSLTNEHVSARMVAVLGDHGAAVFESYKSRRPDATPQELWLTLATDHLFRMPAIRLLEAQGAHAPVWSYLFSWETPVFGGLLRSTHALEVPFVFDNLDRGGADRFTGASLERAALATAMHQAWIAFARAGDPAHAGLPAWPAYEPPRRATMRFDTTCELLDDPAGADREAMESALPRA
jgi:para-nitrobenzyl esterase